MLTRFDEYPVHQSAHPFSFIPSTDLCWSDGMYYAAYSRDGSYVFYTWMRVYPNTDVVDGAAGILFDGGRHYAVRLSRQWRPECDTRIGALAFTFPKPFREIRLAFGDNDSDLRFDLTWIGLAPAFEEMHHSSMHHGKVTTDQTRYTQNGTARGWIEFRGEKIDVDPSSWFGCRDHSWGIYPLWSLSEALGQFTPPKQPEATERALRMWIPSCFDDHSIFYHWHESREAEILEMNDVFGTPFEGRVDFGWGEERPPIKLVDVKHELRFVPGKRNLEGGTIWLQDERGKEWEHRFRVIVPPFLPRIGAWKDGRGNGVYRGALVMEDEEVQEPLERPGAEHISEFTEISDEGEKRGFGHVEFVLAGRYARYGFDKEG
jgi:hypothetical protein